MQVYLDNAATTKPYPEVINTMVYVMQNHWHNPSSLYANDSRQIIENVREQIAQDINADPSNIIFTSGACEANSLAYRVKYYMHVISSSLEHKSIELLNNCHNAMLVKNDKYGFVDCADLEQKLSWDPLYRSLVSIQAANSEIGTTQDLKRISEITHKYNGIFHTDATQLFAERRVDVKELGIDLMSVSAQKFHGGSGVGFLYVKNGFNVDTLIHGSQENEIRGGTYNTPAIAGIGKALEITRKNNASNRIFQLRNLLLYRLLQMDGVTLNGAPVGEKRLCNNINLTIDGVDAEQLVTMCDMYGIYLAKGSACNSYSLKPSSTLTAIGLSNQQAFSTIRITIDGSNTEAEIDYASDIIQSLVRRLRNND